jgi:hypothetical protein
MVDETTADDGAIQHFWDWWAFRVEGRRLDLDQAADVIEALREYEASRGV